MTAGLLLMLYAGSFATLWLATAFTWRRCQAAAGAPIDERGLDVVELAALTGGRERAVIAAITALRRSHVTTGPSGTMLADGPLDEDATDLERELFEAVRASPPAAARSHLQAGVRGAAVERTLTRLQSAGLVLDPRAVLVMHVLWVFAAVLVGAGVVGVVDRLDDHTLTGTLTSPVAAITAASMALLWWIHNHRSGASAAGRRIVNGIGDLGEGLRGRFEHAAFEVAMFGTGVLWTQDWALATALDIPPPAEDDDSSVASQILSMLFNFDSDSDG